MNSTAFWSSLIIAFVAFKFEDNFIAILFFIVAVVAISYQQFGVHHYKKEVKRSISTKKGSISIGLNTSKATLEDVDELTSAYTETAALFRALIKTRDKIKK